MFEIDDSGELKYLNTTRHGKERTIAKRASLSMIVLDEIREMIRSSGIMEFGC